MKEFLLVSMGSFFGGGMRYVVSRLIQSWVAASFPFGTLAVNVIGCMVLGLLSGLPWTGSLMSTSTKLMLTTGFCGGFTTFSTFVNENYLFARDDNFLGFAIYLLTSLLLGFVALYAGYQLARLL